MNANTQTLFDELHSYTATIVEETGWSWDKAWRHIMDTHDHKIKAAGKALALEEIREKKSKLENPTEAIMNMAKQYEKESESQVALFGRLFRENPQTAFAYEMQVKGGTPKMMNASFELTEKAKQYMKASGEKSYKVAFDHVAAENPGLMRQWHVAGK